ncbi:hypothetical protein HID58_041796, partial [Brassica napus]
MYANKRFHLISDLQPFKDAWRVQVKLIHSWIQNPPYADETLEMGLADQTILFLKQSFVIIRVLKFSARARELSLSESNVTFLLENGVGKYKPTKLGYKMNITNDTVFTDSDLTDNSSFLSLASYEEILNGSADTKCLIDIIGQTIDIGEVQIIQVHNEDKKRIPFRIRDNMYCMVMLWHLVFGAVMLSKSNIILRNMLVKTFDLKPFKDASRVQVKLIHSWIQNPPYADETLEMVLADQTDAKVQCSCKRTLIKRVQRNLPLGKWRVIQNMKISGTGGKYKPTKLGYKMNITNDTVFTDSDLTGDSSFLSLASYKEILNGSADTKCLIDIIGQAIDIGEVQIIQVHNEDRKRILFRIRDNIGNALACCLWGRYAEQIEHHLEKHVGEDIVCLIRFSKISEF